jgi:hypothetical protein
LLIRARRLAPIALGLKERGRAINFVAVRAERSSSESGVLFGLRPAVLLDRFSYVRQSLHAVAGVKTRRVDHVAKPRASRQATRHGKTLLEGSQTCIELPVVRRVELETGGRCARAGVIVPR